MKFKVQKVVTSEYEVEAENAERAKFNIEEFGNLKATNAKVFVEEVPEEEHTTLELLNQFIELSEQQLREQKIKQATAEKVAFIKLHAHWEKIRVYFEENIEPLMERINIGSILFGDYGFYSESSCWGTSWKVCQLNKKEIESWKQCRESFHYQNIAHELKESSLHVYNWLFTFCSQWDEMRILLEKELAKQAQQYFKKHKAEAANSTAYYIKEGQNL
jgi:hypothetical protein